MSSYYPLGFVQIGKASTKESPRMLTTALNSQLFKQAHTILGVVVCAMMVLQPFLGFAHHKYYVKHQRRGAISHAHIWYGRALMLVGIINGGLGLQLANAPRSFIIAYVVVTVVIALFGAVAGIIGARRRSHRAKEAYASSSPTTQYAPRQQQRVPYRQGYA
jgi:disulfide bond formation protein DsbB